MGAPYYTNPLVFLIDTVLGAYLLCVMLRFLLQTVRADFYNPISQFLVKVTNPPLRPLRRVIPGLGGIDVASLVLMLALQALILTVISLLGGGKISIAALLILSVAELFSLLIYVYIFAILIMVIISWVNPGSYNPVSNLTYSLTEPLMRPARNLIPPIGGLDLSPMVVMLLLYLLRMLLLPPIYQLALRLS
jgi:YggT family protein